MRIGVRGHDVTASNFEGLVKKIGADGFKCTQLALKKAIKEFPVDRGAMTPGMAMYMKNLFAENKVDVAVLGCYLNLANPDKTQLKEILETYRAHIRFASWLGCGVVGTETGAPNTEYKFVPQSHSEESLSIFIENLRIVVDYAEKLGVTFAIEPVWKHIVYNNKRTRQVLDAINSPNLQIIFDPINLLCEENYQNQDDLVKEAFDLYGDEIAVIHSKDYVIENGKLKTVPSGKGMFNQALLLSYIKKHKPFIHVLLENTTSDNAVATKEFMLQKYNSL